MTKNLFSYIDEVGATLHGQAALLLLDFDGTLAQIVDEPRRAVPLPGMRELLAELARLPDIRVCISSGRQLDDIRERIGLPNLIYAGNHGMEIVGPNVAYVHVKALKISEETHLAARTVRTRLAGFPGALVEDKGLTVSVHYRNVKTELIPSLIQTVEGVIAAFRRSLVTRHGRMLVDILPRVEWSKGEAARWLRRRVGWGHVPICIGDDATDEEAFRAFDDGVSICVNSAANSAAKYSVRDPEEVKRFLVWLVQTRKAAAHEFQRRNEYSVP